MKIPLNLIQVNNVKFNLNKNIKYKRILLKDEMYI